jgi:thiamine biosynthesis lipoprotein
MTSSCADSTVARRARPLLGTLVEISAAGVDECALVTAIGAAFCAVEKVQALMSYHDPFSELSRLNAAAHREPVEVSAWTFTVLRTAQRLAAESDGVFDVTIAPRLASWGYLPRVPANGREELRATWRDIELLLGRRVAFRRPLHIDLGGIAKGFAVDRAVEALRRAGVPAGLVNAGGDLRAFGERDWTVQIRHPRDPGATGHAFALRDAAVATSATYFSRKRWRRCWVCPLVDGTTRLPCDDQLSVSVHAATALLADALTKIVVARREQAAPLLQRHGASALLLDRQGRCQFVAADARPAH